MIFTFILKFYVQNIWNWPHLHNSLLRKFSDRTLVNFSSKLFRLLSHLQAWSRLQHLIKISKQIILHQRSFQIIKNFPLELYLNVEKVGFSGRSRNIFVCLEKICWLYELLYWILAFLFQLYFKFTKFTYYIR